MSIEINKYKILWASTQRYEKVLLFSNVNALRVLKFWLFFLLYFALHLWESKSRVEWLLCLLFLVHMHDTEFLFILLLWLGLINFFIFVYCLAEFAYLYTISLPTRDCAFFEVFDWSDWGISRDIACYGTCWSGFAVGEWVLFGFAIEGWCNFLPEILFLSILCFQFAIKCLLRQRMTRFIHAIKFFFVSPQYFFFRFLRVVKQLTAIESFILFETFK